MKKILISIYIFILFLMMFGCMKNPSLSAPPTPTDVPTFAAYTDLAPVPGGTFTQTDGTSGFSHKVSSFNMGKYLVTYDLWYKVYTWAVAHGYTFFLPGTEGRWGVLGAAPTTSRFQPVTDVNWRDVIVWCNAYSQETGLRPCYTYSDAVIKDSTNAIACDNAVCSWTYIGYRLPTEGEYQCAASYKDGTNWTPWNYASGATADNTNEAATDLVGWDYANTGGTTTKDVGGLAANALGIYDMSGNVFEWCWDWYGTYPAASSMDYKGPANGNYRVIRSCSFSDAATYMSLGSRLKYSPDNFDQFTGFRIARTN